MNKITLSQSEQSSSAAKRENGKPAELMSQGKPKEARENSILAPNLTQGPRPNCGWFHAFGPKGDEGQLDRFALYFRRRGLRTGGGREFCGIAAQRIHDGIAHQTVEDPLALATARHEAGVLEHRQVARHGRRAHRGALGKLAGGEPGLRQPSEDTPTRRGCQCVENSIEIHGDNVNRLANTLIHFFR